MTTIAGLPINNPVAGATTMSTSNKASSGKGSRAGYLGTGVPAHNLPAAVTAGTVTSSLGAPTSIGVTVPAQAMKTGAGGGAKTGIRGTFL